MENLKGTISRLSNTVLKSSGDLVKSTKLSMGVASEEENLRSLYVEIGKKVHEIYMYGGSLGPFFDEKYAEIEECVKRKQELQEQLETVKGTKACPKCGKMLDKAAEFCQKCGTQMDGVVTAERSAPKGVMPVEAPVPVEAPLPVEVPMPEKKPVADADKKMRCGACGAENDSGTKFCLSCGRLLARG